MAIVAPGYRGPTPTALYVSH